MADSITESLNLVRIELAEAVKLSGQGAYHRRAPSPESLPHYEKTRQLLQEILERSPQNCEALMLLSQTYEGLMKFDLAALLLRKAFDAGEPKTNKLMKRLALLCENDKEWQDLALTPGELSELGDFLEERGVGPSHRSRNLTQEWIVNHTDKSLPDVLESLDRRGAFSDFQVLVNLVRG